ncbi:hypothetical protein [Longitalea arenae]|uniref:hypothetical protein n=1 Tax=Longitalea arenae TaxID=2812558 RepID=UPI001967A63B|nr:hypothetical protein [Longitalea arenae]
MQLASSGTSFNYRQDPGGFYITAMVNALFQKEEQAQYVEAVTAFDHCFQLAKQNRLEEAVFAYSACNSISSTLAPSLLDWVMAFYGQRLCYYHYKSKNYEAGASLTKQISKSVNRLYENGHQIMFFVDIQQRLNLSRIYFAQHKVEKAISLCTESVIDMYHKSGAFHSQQFINDVPENELLEITQYGMMVEVLTDACNRILSSSKEDAGQVEKATITLITPLIDLDFSSISNDLKYTGINKFLSLLGGLTGYRELQDSDILYFMNSPYADKKMLMVLNNYIAMANVLDGSP